MLHSSSVKIKTPNINISEVPPKYKIIAKGDSAASKHYWREQDLVFLANLRPYSGPSVTLPDADMIPPSQKRLIPLSKQLFIEAQIATALPQLKSSSLISLGQVCDDDCTVILN